MTKHQVVNVSVHTHMRYRKDINMTLLKIQGTEFPCPSSVCRIFGKGIELISEFSMGCEFDNERNCNHNGNTSACD